MPCRDITEVIDLHLDLDDRVISYALTKRTCGRAVGERALIQNWLAGRTVDAVLAADVNEFLDAYPNDDEALEFLYLKHFFAVKAALAVLVGREAGSRGSACLAESIACDPDGTRFLGQLSIPVLTEKIKSCGRCGSCGSKRAPQKKTPALT